MIKLKQNEKYPSSEKLSYIINENIQTGTLWIFLNF